MAVALDKGFYNTLPKLNTVSREEADIAWMVYDLEMDEKQKMNKLVRYKTVFTKSNERTESPMNIEVGDENKFVSILQSELDDIKEWQLSR
jgi:hypothetical protein